MIRIASILLLTSLFMYSCSPGPKPDPLASLRKKAEKSICKDVRDLTHTSIDAMSLGMGSMIIKSVMSESDQDSLLMKPFLPILKEELKSCDKKTLEGISNNAAERYRFIGSLLLKHREPITATVKESAAWAVPFIDMAISKAQELANKQIDSAVSS